MVSKKKARKVLKVCKAIGEAACAAKFGINVASVRRYCKIAEGAKKESLEILDYLRTAPVDTTAYVNDVKPKFRSDDHNRILVIGDLHTPFDYEPYFDHCVAVFDKYDCNRVVFIGDIIDNHYSSYHETDADGLGGEEELDLAIAKLARWYQAFPNADVTIGNHDRMVMRKAQSSAIPTRWIKEYKEVLGTPEWNFTDRVVYDGVQYIHGEGGTARSRAKKDLMSTVGGHLHTQCYVDWIVGASLKIFGMQVGCGVDADTYAMAYARNYGKPAIGCGVVLNGKVAINEVMSTGGI